MATLVKVTLKPRIFFEVSILTGDQIRNQPLPWQRKGNQGNQHQGRTVQREPRRGLGSGPHKWPHDCEWGGPQVS